MYQWCGFKSRRGKNKHLTALKSNSNTVWFNFQTYIYILLYVCSLLDLIKTSLCCHDCHRGSQTHCIHDYCSLQRQHASEFTASFKWDLILSTLHIIMISCYLLFEFSRLLLSRRRVISIKSSCYLNFVLSRPRVIKISCYQDFLVIETSCYQASCYHNLVLSRFRFIKTLCHQDFMLSRFRLINISCYLICCYYVSCYKHYCFTSVHPNRDMCTVP